MKFEIYRVYTMPAWLLKIQASSFIHNEVIGGRKWPELLREKDGTAVPLFARLGGGTAVPPDIARYIVLGNNVVLLKENKKDVVLSRELHRTAKIIPITMGKVFTSEAQRFMVDCLMAAGAECKPALQQAELLIRADMIGHPSHGLNRLGLYVNDILQKVCMPNNEPKILKESDATAWVDANNVLGATGGHFAMDLAIQKACKSGVGWVAVKGSNHNGMLGYWAQKAVNYGMIGVAFSNTSPLVAPTRSKKAALGTNPLSVVAPGTQNEIFYLDMATSAVAFGKVEMKRHKGEPLPSGWAQGPDGKETKDAKIAADTKCLMPLGGSEQTSGHKGFGLAAMVEVFTGILAGSCYAHHIRAWTQTGTPTPANLGQCYVAVNPRYFAPGFHDRVTDCILHWRKLEPTNRCRPVMAIGDKEKKAARETAESGIVSYVPSQIEASAALAKKLNVKPLTVT